MDINCNYKLLLFEGDCNITEAVHKSIVDILNHPTLPLHQKLNHVTRTIRGLVQRGESTGLEGGKPKKGSSRAVIFPTEHKEITLDGKPANVRSVYKIAFHGALDKHRLPAENLLGEEQNNTEADYLAQRSHGIIYPDEPTGHYKTNPEGILAPLYSSHPENHWLEFGHVEKLSKPKFSQLTKTPDHPKGLKFDEVYHAVNREWADAHGERYMFGSSANHDKIMQHPLVSNLMEFIYNHDQHPGDLREANWGVWNHPHTGKEYPVIRDYGFSRSVAKMYHERRKRYYDQRAKNRVWG